MRRFLVSVYFVDYLTVLHYLALWSRVLFKALTVAKRVNIAHFVWSRKARTVCRVESTPVYPTLESNLVISSQFQVGSQKCSHCFTIYIQNRKKFSSLESILHFLPISLPLNLSSQWSSVTNTNF
jgi:hypothetical protein